MKLSLATAVFLASAISSVSSFAQTNPSPKAADASASSPAPANNETSEENTTPFVVGDIPHEALPPGFLGEPGAPSLDKQRELLAKSLLQRGLCDEDYFGKDYCEKLRKKLNVKAPSETNQAKVLPDSESLGHISSEAPEYND